VFWREVVDSFLSGAISSLRGNSSVDDSRDISTGIFVHACVYVCVSACGRRKFRLTEEELESVRDFVPECLRDFFPLP